MAPNDSDRTDRRKFLTAGAVATASALTIAQSAPGQIHDSSAKAATLPTRKLGKSGIEVTILNQGAVRSPERVLRTAFASGIRIFDTAKVYGTEPKIKEWFDREPTIRKQIFLVTKDMPKTPSDLLKMTDDRLKTLGTDYIDLLFIHGLGDMHKLENCIKMVKSKELAETAEALKKSGKVRLVGFSSHHKDRAAIIKAAAEGGIVDAIMLQYRPWLDKESPLNKALDAAWKKGIGLISMKQIAGNGFGDKPTGNILDDVKKRVPLLAERNLTPFQGLLHAIWSDERITCACVSMPNTDFVRENADAARRFEPVKAADLERLRDTFMAYEPTLCADCDGRCSKAAGTTAELGNLTRFLTYYQQHGDRSLARDHYANMPLPARDWSGADLEAARSACPGGLNFAKLLPEVEKHLA
jgi:predicted aldo/keto reductase-like oxidoreductase